MQYLPAGKQDQALLAILRQRIRWAPVETLRRNAKQPGKLMEQLSRRGVLVKDVHICLAVESIWAALHPKIVILVRHPCAMAQSWQRLGLEVRFRIENLLAQDALMIDYLGLFASHLNQHPDDFFFNFGAYWGASYYVMEQLSRQHPTWQWITHEALCVDSVQRYTEFVERLGIKISPRGSRALEKFIQTYNRRRTGHENEHSVARLTAAEPDKWKNQLTQKQIDAVLAGAQPFGLVERFFENA